MVSTEWILLLHHHEVEKLLRQRPSVLPVSSCWEGSNFNGSSLLLFWDPQALPEFSTLESVTLWFLEPLYHILREILKARQSCLQSCLVNLNTNTTEKKHKIQLDFTYTILLFSFSYLFSPFILLFSSLLFFFFLVLPRL